MSLKRSFSERLFQFSKISHQYLTRNCRISSSPRTRIRQNPGQPNIRPDPGDAGIFRRFFHKPAAFSPELRPLPVGEGLIEKIRGFDFVRDRIRLDGLSPPPNVIEEVAPEEGLMAEDARKLLRVAQLERVKLRVREMGKKWIRLDGLSPPPTVIEEVAPEEGLTAEDARKLLRVAQLERVKLRVREMGKKWISYSEFVRVCGEDCSDPEYGFRVARSLDESGSVVILGNLVLLKPDQVLKAIGGLIPLPATNPSDPRRRELQEMEKEKGEIDRKARTLVRRELWGGLGFLIVQTAGFMRLTFWELSWDVMEPICFYLTSMYFMAGYAFFLRTSKEPSFEGFYQSRFVAKQKQLMEHYKFDMERYNELRKICYPHSSLDRIPTMASFEK